MDDFNTQLEAFSHRVLNKQQHNSEISISEKKEVKNAPEKEVVLYQTDDGNVNVSVFYYDETFWLTQKALSELFGTSKQTISYHLNNIFTEGELSQISVVKEFLTTANDGKKYKTLYYNL